MSFTKQALALAFLGVACAPESPIIGKKAWTGEHLEVWTTEDAIFCGGSFEALDRHAQLVSEFATRFGVESRAKRHRYFWTSRREFENGGFCRSSACVQLDDPFHIYAYGFSAHELVHAEFANGHSSFADEALAVMMGDSSLETAEDVPSMSVAAIIDETEGRALDGRHYHPAAKFVGALEELYPDEFLQPLLRTHPSDDFQEFSARITEADVDIDAALELNESEGQCAIESFRVALSECSTPPIAWQETRWHASGRLDCSSTQTQGPAIDGQTIWTIRSVDVEEAGVYTAWLATQSDALIATMVACDTPWCGIGFGAMERDDGYIIVEANTANPVDLQPGRYWFRVAQSLNEAPGEFDLYLIPDWPTGLPPE